MPVVRARALFSILQQCNGGSALLDNEAVAEPGRSGHPRRAGNCRSWCKSGADCAALRRKRSGCFNQSGSVCLSLDSRTARQNIEAHLVNQLPLINEFHAGFHGHEKSNLTIAVLSGKGGTGKTLVSVNLAAAAEAAVLFDCDVEEPNGTSLLQAGDHE